MSASGSEGGSLLMGLAKAAAFSGGIAIANAGRRAATGALTGLIATVLFGVSLCFLTLSGYRAIAGTLGDVYAGLIVGSAYLFAALLAVVAFQARRR